MVAKIISQKRSLRLIAAYGITFNEYRQLFGRQGRKCAICGALGKNPTLADDQKLDMVVDHCHVTGRVRGLLCNHCNTALGFFRDSVDVMQKAIEYIHQAKISPPLTRRERHQAKKSRKKNLVKGISLSNSD